MTHWSREYLYTGQEKEKEKHPEVCSFCKFFRPAAVNTSKWHMRIGYCIAKDKDRSADNWCYNYKKV